MSVLSTHANAVPPPSSCGVCERKHRSWHTAAKCRWRRALWVEGNGRWASVAHCHPGATVILFDTKDEALEAKAVIDGLACGGRCHRRHEVVAVDNLARWRD